MSTQPSRTDRTVADRLRLWFRRLHRDLSFLFSGMLLVYAVSGIALNHKDKFNSQYSVSVTELQLPTTGQPSVSRAEVDAWLQPQGLADRYLQHYSPEAGKVKVFLRGGSSLTVDVKTGHAVLEEVRPRPVLGNLSRLHYNPGRAWTVFSDLFAVCLVLIVLTGLFMLKGKHGLKGWGGVELLVGILIPLLFALLR